MLCSAGQSLWVPLTIPVRETQAINPLACVRTLVCEAEGIPRQLLLGRRAEATGEIPQKGQPVIHILTSFVSVLFLLCVLCLRGPTTQQQEGSMQCRPRPTLTGLREHPHPNLFLLCKSEGRGVGEKETQSSQAKKLCRKASGPDPLTPTHTAPSRATQHPCYLGAGLAGGPNCCPPPHSH